ncbi:hypothetical protein DMENIID0001_074350 [Sergentomyia squamirostris]
MIAKLKKKATVGVKKNKKLEKKVSKKPKVKQEVQEIKEEPVEEVPKPPLKGISKRFNVKKNKVKTNESKTTTKEIKSGKGKNKGSKFGVVQIKCLPHGFFEEQLKGFFKQFGEVRRVRVVRSLKTGKSTGTAYIEFRVPEVAEIAAETMNNYLLMKCILKTKYISPENVSPKLMKPRVKVKIENGSEIVISSETCRRMKYVHTYNKRASTEEKAMKIQKKLDKKLEAKKRKLAEAGIDFDVDLVIKRPKPASKDEDPPKPEEEKEEVPEKIEKTKNKKKKAASKVLQVEEAPQADPKPSKTKKLKEKPAEKIKKLEKKKESLKPAPKVSKKKEAPKLIAKKVKAGQAGPKVGGKKAKKSQKVSK